MRPERRNACVLRGVPSFHSECEKEEKKGRKRKLKEEKSENCPGLNSRARPSSYPSVW